MEQDNKDHSKDIETIKKHIDSWKELSEDDLEFEKLAGLSNIVWKVTVSKEYVELKTVIYRIFGKGNDLVDRNQENYVFDELAKLKLGPRCYGYSSKYRIEEFCKGKPSPDCITRIPVIRRKLARRVSILHAVELKQLDKKPYFLKNLDEGIYLKEIEKKLSTTKFDEREKKMIDEIKNTLLSKEEIDFLHSILPTDPDSIKFSHNDLHGGNIIYVKEEDTDIFIDFEYSCFNYRAFDIANLFIESMIDYENDQYPYYKLCGKHYASDIEREEFVRYYTFYTVVRDNLAEEDFVKVIEDPEYINEYLKKINKTSEFEAKMQQILTECQVGELLSHYHWTLWSITFSKKKEIQFDYIAYAYDRFQLYKEAKAKFLAEINNSE